MRTARNLIAALLLPAAVAAGAEFRIHDSVSLSEAKFEGIKVRELSGLAWDRDEQLLYAVSDKGYVYHFRLSISGERIEALRPVHAARLQDIDRGSELPRRANAEGLALLDADNGVRGDTQLVIALEDGPAVLRFTPRGEAVAEIELPTALRDPLRYRSRNKRLESVAVHPQHGILVAPESPLRDQPDALHTVYSTAGKRWSFDASHRDGSDIKAIETLPDGRLLILERAGAGALRRFVLRTLDLSTCGADRRCVAQSMEAPADARLTGRNFEGLARVSDTLYMLVSDDGDEALQRTTTFVLFGLREP